MNIGTVVLYLKGVKLAVSEEALVNDLEDENKLNEKIYFISLVMYATGLVLVGFSYLL